MKATLLRDMKIMQIKEVRKYKKNQTDFASLCRNCIHIPAN